MTPEDKDYCDSVTVAGSHPAKYNVFEVVERIIEKGVEGDFIEAGACGGGQIAVMDRALQKHGKERIIHAFDSWDGIPKATEEDDPPQKAEYGVRSISDPIISSGKLMSTEENFWANMKKWGARSAGIKAYKGWLQDTLPRFEPVKCALLRIDVDLTESVRVAVKHLYPMLVSGGFCIFDDWYTSPSAQRQALLDFMKEHGEVFSEFTEVKGNDGTVWWRKP